MAGSRAEGRHTFTAFEVVFCLRCPFSNHLNHTTLGHVSVGHVTASRPFMTAVLKV